MAVDLNLFSVYGWPSTIRSTVRSNIINQICIFNLLQYTKIIIYKYIDRKTNRRERLVAGTPRDSCWVLNHPCSYIFSVNLPMIGFYSVITSVLTSTPFCPTALEIRLISINTFQATTFFLSPLFLLMSIPMISHIISRSYLSSINIHLIWKNTKSHRYKYITYKNI